jgi:hypothetical protein
MNLKVKLKLYVEYRSFIFRQMVVAMSLCGFRRSDKKLGACQQFLRTVNLEGTAYKAGMDF